MDKKEKDIYKTKYKIYYCIYYFTTTLGEGALLKSRMSSLSKSQI